MKALNYSLNSSINYPLLKDFIEKSIVQFYNELDNLYKLNYYNKILLHGSEGTFADLFNSALKKSFPCGTIITISQLGWYKVSQEYGFSDLIIILNNEIIIVLEYKNIWTYNNEPNSSYWGNELALQHYNGVIAQAKHYFELDRDFFSTFKSIYFMGVTFSRFELSIEPLNDKWKYKCEYENEFYGFKLLPLQASHEIGFAIYGKIKKYMNIEFVTKSPREFPDTEIKLFVEMLKKQGEVVDPTSVRVLRCNLICFAKFEGKCIGISAIKEKTNWDFDNDKANLPDERLFFEWELGYLHVLPEFEKNGVGSAMTTELLHKYGIGNLMATTDINNVKTIHLSIKNPQKMLGLFLRKTNGF